MRLIKRVMQSYLPNLRAGVEIMSMHPYCMFHHILKHTKCMCIVGIHTTPNDIRL